MIKHLTLPALSLLPILLSIGSAIWMTRANNKNSYDWFLRVFLSAAITVFAFVAFPWGLLSYYLRFALPIVFFIALIKSSTRLKNREIFARSERKGRLKINIKLLLLAGFIALSVLSIKPYFEENKSVADISFPLKDGRFAIVQGGDSMVTNAIHRLDADEIHAIDIVQLNLLGAHASGFFPESLSDYEIYGKTVLSPCSGRIITTQDKIIDNYPGETDVERPDGNLIVMECADLRVTFKHLKSRSIAVKPGDEVRSGRAVAMIGNSGDSSAPHLHMSVAKKRGKSDYAPIQASFNKTVPTMNRLFDY